MARRGGAVKRFPHPAGATTGPARQGARDCSSSSDTDSWRSDASSGRARWWDGTAWRPSATGYDYLGGVCTSSPQVVARGPNRLDVFVTGPDSALYHKWWDGTAWWPTATGYQRLGGVCTGEPEVVACGPDRLDVFVTGPDSALHHKWWDGTRWLPSPLEFESLGVPIGPGSAPAQPELSLVTAAT